MKYPLFPAMFVAAALVAATVATVVWLAYDMGEIFSAEMYD